MKKIASAVLAIMMLFTCLVIPSDTVWANNVSVGISASSVNIGDSVTVTVTVPTGITAQIDVAYASDLLSFSSCSTTANNNGSSVTMNLGSFSTPTATVTFKAVAAGTATFTVTPVTAGSEETAEEVPLGGGSASVTIANQVAPAPSDPGTTGTPGTTGPVVSDNNQLKRLEISPGTLTPAFHPDTTNYKVTVDYNVTKLSVSALAAHEKAVVSSVSGANNLKVGDNTVSIVVKAENGVSKTYKIVVTRKAEEGASSESEVKEDAFIWNGSALEFKDSIPQTVIPEGFTAAKKVINNKEVPILEFKDGLLTLVYLSNEAGDTNLYIYDPVANDVYPFVLLTNGERRVMVLRPDDANAPEGYISCTLSIEGKGVVSAYKFNMDALSTEETLEENTTSWWGAETFFAAEVQPSDFYLIYCLNQNGEYGWYQYDAVEESFQRYSAALFQASVGVEADDEADTEPISGEIEELEQKMMTIIIVAAVVVVLLLIIIVVLAIRLKRYKDDLYYEEDDEYDDEYEDYEEDDASYEDDDEDAEDVTDLGEDSDDEVEIEFYEMESDDDTQDDEVEIEFYEMESDDAEDDEVEIEFYEMDSEDPKEKPEMNENIRFYEMEPENEISDMELLLIQEAMRDEKENQPKRVVTPINDVDDDDDFDLEFIDLD